MLNVFDQDDKKAGTYIIAYNMIQTPGFIHPSSNTARADISQCADSGVLRAHRVNASVHFYTVHMHGCTLSTRASGRKVHQVSPGGMCAVLGLTCITKR